MAASDRCQARRQPVAGRQQSEPVIDPVQQLGHAQRLHPRRRQLNRQRHPVQPRHQLRYRWPGLPVQCETHIGAARPVGEQRDRLRPLHARRRVTRPGQGQRRQPVPGLSGHPQRLPAGRQHPHIITGRQQPGAQSRRRGDHVLAVIQHQQQLLPGQHPRYRLGRRHPHPRLVPHSQRCRHHCRHQRRVPHRCQLRQPHPVGEPARHPPGYLTGQPGLARTARTGYRRQPVLTQQAPDLAHRFRPADEARQRRWEAVYATRLGSHRRPPHARTITARCSRRTACCAPLGS